MSPTLRRMLVLLAGVAALVLGLVALVATPSNELDLLAGGVLAAGAGLIVSVAP